MNTHINTLISAGADAMQNMYEVGFVFPTSLGIADEVAENLKIRTAGFTPPEDSQQTYEVHWKTVSLTRPSTKITLDRTFTLTFRIDAHYEEYKALLYWKGKTSVGSLGYASQDLDNLGEVKVKALDNPVKDLDDVTSAAGTPGAIVSTSMEWDYKDVWIESITHPEYSSESGEPVTVIATFRFGDFTDPHSKIES